MKYENYCLAGATLFISLISLIMAFIFFGPFYYHCYINSISKYNETIHNCRNWEYNICKSWHEINITCFKIELTINNHNYTIVDCENEIKLGNNMCYKSLILDEVKILTKRIVIMNIFYFLYHLLISLAGFIFFIIISIIIIIKIRKRNGYQSV